jgi:uncharacterized protein (TIGR02996 family)
MPPAASLRATLEAALAANPDDAAAFAAYADHLLEQGDPRGELVQVQLALEDPARPAAERRRLQAREKVLLDQHAAGWMGDVGRFLAGDWSGEDRPFHYRFARGWLDFVRLLPFPDAAVAALARSPEARLLRTLEVVYDMRFHPHDFDAVLEGPIGALRQGEEANETYEEADLLPPLIASPYLTNLRSFTLGFGGSDRPVYSGMVGTFNNCTADQVVDLLGKCPRLEELYLNTSVPDVEGLFASPALAGLRVLQYYFGAAEYDREGEAYPLSYLADNPAAGRLTTLRLHPGRDATVPIDELDVLLNSTRLPKLEHLQFRMTAFGD